VHATGFGVIPLRQRLPVCRRGEGGAEPAPKAGKYIMPATCCLGELNTFAGAAAKRAMLSAPDQLTSDPLRLPPPNDVQSRTGPETFHSSPQRGPGGATAEGFIGRKFLVKIARSPSRRSREMIRGPWSLNGSW